jgi:regulator of replication initiation timing
MKKKGQKKMLVEVNGKVTRTGNSRIAEEKKAKKKKPDPAASSPPDPRQVTVEDVVTGANTQDAVDRRIEEAQRAVSPDRNFTEAVVATVKDDVESLRAKADDAREQLTESREANRTLRRSNEKLLNVLDAVKPFRACVMEEVAEDGSTTRCEICPGCALEKVVQAYRNDD